MSIIGSLPNNLTNGTTADATQVMANFNAIVNAVNNTSTGAASIPGVQQSSYNYAADSGTVNNIIIGMTPSPAVYTDGLQGNFKAANTNTSTTVNIKYGSLGNKALVIDQAGTLPPIGSIISGMHYRTEYDSTQDKVILINPSSATASFTMTLSGFTTTVTTTVNWRMDANAKIVVVTVTADATGTSNSTAMTATGIPSAIAIGSAAGARLMFPGVDNSVRNAVFATGLNGTTWTFTYSFSLSAFTGSGTKGVFASVGTYSA